MTWSTRYEGSLLHTFTTPPLQLVSGEGCHVVDSDGRRYLDFLAGIAVNALGHAHPAFVEAVSRQAATLAHVSNLFATEPQIRLAERLQSLTGAGEQGRVYLANSGTEANEAALKLARRTGRPRILSLEGSFHGRTLGALSVTGKAALRDPFEPLLPGVEFLDSTVEALEAAIGDDVAALIVEPIKGEAGVVELPAGYLAAAREITARHGALLILDEIQTGVARTGEWFHFQSEGIVPDAITLAKGLGGGVPIGAMITFGAASDLITVGQHGSTFGGNALASAAALAVLDTVESEGLVANARLRGEQLRAGIRAIGSPLVGELRGRGLLVGVALTAPVAPAVLAAAREAGLIVNAPNDRTIRLAPPLIIGDAEIAEFLDRFTRALESVS
jgi:acetylornithine/N-succinyldiaminopimelate aminotransferase